MSHTAVRQMAAVPSTENHSIDPTRSPTPVVFQCRKCNTILGDSYGLVGSSPELNAVGLFAKSHNVEVARALMTSTQEQDFGSSFSFLACKGCGATVGKRYVTTPNHLDELRNKYLFLNDLIKIYALGSFSHDQSYYNEPKRIKFPVSMKEVFENMKELSDDARERNEEMKQMRQLVLLALQNAGMVDASTDDGNQNPITSAVDVASSSAELSTSITDTANKEDQQSHLITVEREQGTEAQSRLNDSGDLNQKLPKKHSLGNLKASGHELKILRSLQNPDTPVRSSEPIVPSCEPQKSSGGHNVTANSYAVQSNQLRIVPQVGSLTTRPVPVPIPSQNVGVTAPSFVSSHPAPTTTLPFTLPSQTTQIPLQSGHITPSQVTTAISSNGQLYVQVRPPQSQRPSIPVTSNHINPSIAAQMLSRNITNFQTGLARLQQSSVANTRIHQAHSQSQLHNSSKLSQFSQATMQDRFMSAIAVSAGQSQTYNQLVQEAQKLPQKIPAEQLAQSPFYSHFLKLTNPTPKLSSSGNFQIGQLKAPIPVTSTVPASTSCSTNAQLQLPTRAQTHADVSKPQALTHSSTSALNTNSGSGHSREKVITVHPEQVNHTASKITIVPADGNPQKPGQTKGVSLSEKVSSSQHTADLALKASTIPKTAAQPASSDANSTTSVLKATDRSQKGSDSTDDESSTSEENIENEPEKPHATSSQSKVGRENDKTSSSSPSVPMTAASTQVSTKEVSAAQQKVADTTCPSPGRKLSTGISLSSAAKPVSSPSAMALLNQLAYKSTDRQRGNASGNEGDTNTRQHITRVSNPEAPVSETLSESPPKESLKAKTSKNSSNVAGRGNAGVGISEVASTRLSTSHSSLPQEKQSKANLNTSSGEVFADSTASSTPSFPVQKLEVLSKDAQAVGEKSTWEVERLKNATESKSEANRGGTNSKAPSKSKPPPSLPQVRATELSSPSSIQNIPTSDSVSSNPRKRKISQSHDSALSPSRKRNLSESSSAFSTSSTSLASSTDTINERIRKARKSGAQSPNDLTEFVKSNGKRYKKVRREIIDLTNDDD